MRSLELLPAVAITTISAALPGQLTLMVRLILLRARYRKRLLWMFWATVRSNRMKLLLSPYQIRSHQARLQQLQLLVRQLLLLMTTLLELQSIPIADYLQQKQEEQQYLLSNSTLNQLLT